MRKLDPKLLRAHAKSNATIAWEGQARHLLNWAAYLLEAAEKVVAERAEVEQTKPAAWLVPHLIDLKGSGGCVLADHDGKKAALIDGTVAWSAEIFCDSQERGVIDRNGVTHFAKPLYARLDGPGGGS